MNVALITTSKLSSFLLVTLCFSFITTFVAGDPCEPVGCGCHCTNENGTYEISLEGLHGEPGKRFHLTAGSWVYYIDPCNAFSENSDCKDVTMCQVPTGTGDSFPIAKSGIESCGNFVDDETPIVVKYSKVEDSGTNRQMIINLKCGKSVIRPTTLTEGPASDDPVTYTFDLTTKKDCHKKVQPSSGDHSGGGGPSTGSILVIVFFVVLVIYLVAGILFMKYKRGATGKEVIPNVEFWSSLPGLIKDGCVFFGQKMKELCGRCCNREGYSEI